MFKKIGICVFCLMLTARLASADISNIVVDSGSGVVSISGASKKNSKISVVVTKPDIEFENLSETALKNQTVLVYEALCDENGEYGILFRMPKGAASGKYRVIVNGESKSFYYADAAELETALTMFKNATEDTLEGIIKKYSRDTSVVYLETGDEYDSYMENETSNRFFCAQTVKNIGKYEELTADDVILCFNQGIEITRYSFGSAENIEKALQNNYLNIEFENDIDTDKLSKVFFEIREPSADLNELKSQIHTASAITKVNTTTKGAMTSVLEKYNDVLKLDLNGVYAKVDKIQVNKALCGKDFKSVAEIKNAFDKACADELKGDKKSSGSSGGSGGSTGGGFSVGEQPADKPKTEKKTRFTDLDEALWAEEYINKLYADGIVSGVGENKFEPLRCVTREEFLKMLVSAFKIQPSEGENRFDDVKKGAWYESAVICGVENGIIKGKNEKLFGTGDNITREDACVMTARVLLKCGAEMTLGSMNFADNEIISDYALDSVNMLLFKKIISGTPDGNFNPKAYLTRAEAAKIVCLAMKAGD